MEETKSTIDYLHETEIKEFMVKAAALFQLNGTSTDPLFVATTTYLALTELGLDPKLTVGYLWKSDAPTILLPYPWVETNTLSGRTDVTDVTQFPDISKRMSILGLVMCPPGSFECVYYTHPPSSITVPTTKESVPLTILEDCPSVTKIRNTLENIALYRFERNKRISNSNEQIEDILANARKIKEKFET